MLPVLIFLRYMYLRDRERRREREHTACEQGEEQRD